MVLVFIGKNKLEKYSLINELLFINDVVLIKK